MRRPRQLVIGGEWMRLLVPAFAFAFVVLVDQVAKAAAFHSPAQGLIPAWNPGFLLGVGAGPRAMLVVLSAAAVLVFVALVGRWSVQIGVPAIIPAVIAGGMLSNTLDRVRFGSVRDFLYAPPLIINLADVAVAGGILLLAVAVVWRLTELHRARQTIAFDSRRLRAVVVARGLASAGVALPVRPPFEPMLAKLARDFPPSGNVLYEPKWDGFRCVVFRDGDELDLQSRNQRPLLRYFPELREPLLTQLPEQIVLDGEIVVAGERGLDFDALQLRQHPADSRVQKLALEIPASYIAFDILALGRDSLLDVPFEERRSTLERTLAKRKAPLYVTPATRDKEIATDWFNRFEGAGFDGVVAKPLPDAYHPGQRSMVKVKHERTCDCVVAGFRIHKDGKGVGSLLCGLYDDDGTLHHVGVASGMAAKLRTEMLAEVEPLRKNALEDHPWRDWAEAMHGADAGRMPGGPSRWNATKDLSWEPVRIERVCEVAYEGLMNGRFRHNARFRAWRDDKRVEECTYAQLESIAPAELREMFH